MGKLSVNLNGLELKNPIMTASGTYDYASEYNDFISGGLDPDDPDREKYFHNCF